jgi:hypothetical protein
MKTLGKTDIEYFIFLFLSCLCLQKKMKNLMSQMATKDTVEAT